MQIDKNHAPYWYVYVLWLLRDLRIALLCITFYGQKLYDNNKISLTYTTQKGTKYERDLVTTQGRAKEYKNDFHQLFTKIMWFRPIDGVTNFLKLMNEFWFSGPFRGLP